MGLGQGQLIHRLGHGEQALKIQGAVGADRQLFEDAAAAVVDHHHREAPPQLGAPEPAVGVMQQGQIAAEQQAGAEGLGNAAGFREGAIDPRGAAKAEHRPEGGGGIGKTGPVAHGRAVGQHQGKPRRQQAAELAGQGGFADGSSRGGGRGQLLFKQRLQPRHRLLPGVGQIAAGWGWRGGEQILIVGAGKSERRHPGLEPQGELGPHQSEGIEGPRIPLAHQHLVGPEALQPTLEPAAGRQAAEPQHLGGGQGGLRCLQQ